MKSVRPATLARLSLLAAGLSLTSAAWATPPVIIDRELNETFCKSMEDFAGKDGVPTADSFAKQAGPAPRLQSTVPLPTPPATAPASNYNSLSRSVFVVGMVNKCDKCPKWHLGGTATAWCIGADGLMITNSHVFEHAQGGAAGVFDSEGKCYPVTELLGYDKASDVAVFRVKAQNLQALRLGATAEVGDPLTVISHPQNHYYVHSEGTVARYTARRGKNKDNPLTTWMAITADYAKGSSGAPIFNAAGEVVGMVSSTHSIYTGNGPADKKGTPSGELQMVVRECVPVDNIRALFEPAKTQAAK